MNRVVGKPRANFELHIYLIHNIKPTTLVKGVNINIKYRKESIRPSMEFQKKSYNCHKERDPNFTIAYIL